MLHLSIIFLIPFTRLVGGGAVEDEFSIMKERDWGWGKTVQRSPTLKRLQGLKDVSPQQILRSHAIDTQLCSKKSQLEMITSNFGPTVSQFTKIMLIYAHAH